MYTGLGPRTFATETGSFVNLYFFSIHVLSHPTCSCHMKLSSHRHYAPSAAPAITLPPHPVWLDAVSPSFPVLPLLRKSLFPRARWHSPSPLCPCWTQDRHALRTVHLIATHPHGCPHKHNTSIPETPHISVIRVLALRTGRCTSVIRRLALRTGPVSLRHFCKWWREAVDVVTDLAVTDQQFRVVVRSLAYDTHEVRVHHHGIIIITGLADVASRRMWAVGCCLARPSACGLGQF